MFSHRIRSLPNPAVRALAACSIALAAASCVLAPAGYDDERERSDVAGKPYEQPPEHRELPELTARPTWREVLERAFLANGDLEAAYFEWRAALERVEIAAGWPNTSLMPSFSYMFSSGSMKAWDRTTVNLGFDGSENLELPVKTRKAAEVALADARAAGERFREAKFLLQKRVLDGWLDLALAEEGLRIARADLELLRVVAGTAAPRVQSGGPQRELLQADIEVREAENRVLNAGAEARAIRAMLNGMLARDAYAPLEVGEQLPEPRGVPDDDARVLALGVDSSPELAALANTIEGREDALELARLMYLPNVNPFAGFTGGVSQVVGVAVMLPTTLPEIRGGIAEARAMLAEVRAMERQARLDRTASFVAGLIVLRNSAREAELFQGSVLPAARLLASTTQQSYAAGSADLLELIEAQRTLLDVRLMVAQARIERERRVAELEQLAGVDFETVANLGEEQ
ncbi:MAG: TolC family protein [Planctomycetes bacterium]|nr:TolC family protein [Planctomycetota bacterium]